MRATPRRQGTVPFHRQANRGQDGAPKPGHLLEEARSGGPLTPEEEQGYLEAMRHLLPVRIPRGKPGMAQALRELGMAEQDRHEIEQVLTQCVREARALGATWGVVGAYLGLTAEGARDKYVTRAHRPPRRRGGATKGDAGQGGQGLG